MTNFYTFLCRKTIRGFQKLGILSWYSDGIPTLSPILKALIVARTQKPPTGQLSPVGESDHNPTLCVDINALQRGFAELGLGWPEETPVETALSTDTSSVSAKRVVEAGSPALNEAAPAAE